MGASHNYAQSVIGDCGHVCAAWPQVGSNKIICDICTAEKYGIDNTEGLSVWVRTKDPAGPFEREAKKARKKAATSKPKVKKVRCFVCQQSGHIYIACPLLGSQTELPYG